VEHGHKRIRIDWRKPGGRVPANTVIVARPSRWGNPFVVLPDLKPGTEIRSGRHTYIAVPTAEEAVRRFREEYMTPDWREAARRELKGKDLACYCKLDEPCHADDEPCHADVLIEIANS
jgi:hypothetical protein